MNSQVRAEFFKLRTTRTTMGLLAAMLGLVVTAVLLHGYGLSVGDLDTRSNQLTLLVGWGAVLGGLFAGLLGAMSFTGEIRHGTIRPTLLFTPRRDRLIVAKCLAGSAAGFGFGLLATSVAAVAGRVVLGARGLDVRLDGGDVALLLAGGALTGALWAVVGVGVGALIRSQVPAVVGILAWVLFVEQQLVGNVPKIGRLAPGALGQAVSGLNPDVLLTPALGAVLLALYAIVLTAAGSWATKHRDFV